MDRNLRQKIDAFPLTSGVYIMKNAQGDIIYIGKAVSLRRRIQSYFRSSRVVSKTDALAVQIADIEVIETASEAEALILEAGFIKKYKPKFNVELKDDKSYPYIEVTNERFSKISIARPREKKKGYKYYGPYVNAKLVRQALGIIRKIFHFRACDPFPKKECLDYHIGLCGAPCIQNIDQKTYAKNIRNVCLILEGEKDALYKNLREEMETLTKEQRFEEAARARDRLRAISALYSGSPDINDSKEAEQLQRVLNLPRPPERIEAFDISNIMGEQAVGSMVSFFNGRPDKGNYRHFRIKGVSGIDDFKMIAEIVQRRYRRLKEERLAFPDLILIDGGRGQLSAASSELKSLGVQIPIVSIAKREEEIFLPQRKSSIILPARSLGLKLLQRVRDEAHRFAINYHRKLRGKAALEKL